MIVLFKKEFKSYFTSPLAYTYLSVFLFFSGLYFVFVNLFQTNTAFHYVLNKLVMIVLFLTPVFTMRMLSEERRTKTDQLLYTSCQSITGIVVGKYLAAFALFLLGTLITIIYPIILSSFGKVVVSQLIASYIGFILIGGSFIAIGTLISAITESQITSAIGTLGVLLIIWFGEPIALSLPKDSISGLIFICVLSIAFAAIIYLIMKNLVVSVILGILGVGVAVALFFIDKSLFYGIIGNFFGWFALIDKNTMFNEGVIAVSSVLYYISFIVIMLLMPIKIIEKRRWS